MEKEQIREIIAKRVAMELKDGDVVNLGIGLPTAVPDYLPEGVQIFLQSENGLLGMGPTPAPGEEDPEFINAGGGFVTALEGASCFDSATSFGIIRGGHVHGAFGRQRQRTFLEDFGCAFGRVFHGQDHLVGTREQVHRTAHAGGFLARDDPVGQVAFFIDRKSVV